jgi:hypothetical protein
MRSFPFTLTLTAKRDPESFRASLTSAAGRAEGHFVPSLDLVAPLPFGDKALAKRGAQLLVALKADTALKGGLQADGAPLRLLVVTPPAPSRVALAPWDLLCEPG